MNDGVEPSPNQRCVISSWPEVGALVHQDHRRQHVDTARSRFSGSRLGPFLSATSAANQTPSRGGRSKATVRVGEVSPQLGVSRGSPTQQPEGEQQQARFLLPPTSGRQMSPLHHRKGGTLDVGGKKTITVRYEGREHAVSWFAGASDEAITRTVEIALGLPRGTPAIVRDPEDGSALAVSDSLPDGLTLDATAVPAGSDGDRRRAESSGNGFYGRGESGNNSNDAKPTHNAVGGIGGGSDGGGSGGGGGAAHEFRGELLKFERVNAHLANERTWLAWVRTALSVLGVALSLISLTDDMGSATMDSTAMALGVAFVACTLFTYMTGWLRYTRVKEVLSWTGSQVKGRFGRFGLKYFTWFLGASLVLTVPVYFIAGVNVVEDA